MDFGYLGNVVLSGNFIYALALMTGILWAIMKSADLGDSFWGAIGLAFLAVIFLPVMLEAMQAGALFFLLLLLGAILLSEIYCWSLSTGVLVAIVALLSAAMILPKF